MSEQAELMRCQDHDREHCPEPRCHVLAVCAATLEPAPTPKYPEATKRWYANWADARGYPGWRASHGWTPHTPAGVMARVAGQIAARLVAWMRWRGERKAGPMRISATGDIPEMAWGAYGPGHYHPLDALEWCAGRVQSLRSYDSADGTNWGTVFVYLDWLTGENEAAQGWAWEQVHEWREPREPPTWGEGLARELMTAQETIRNWRP